MINILLRMMELIAKVIQQMVITQLDESIDQSGTVDLSPCLIPKLNVNAMSVIENRIMAVTKLG